MMKSAKHHVFICGSKSIGQYGGYETFVDKLSEYLEPEEGIQLHIACKANGDGCMDESKLSGVTQVNGREFRYHGAHCFKVQVPDIGPAAAIWYDIASIRACISYCRRYQISGPVFYVLACRIGPFIAGLKREIQKLGGVLYVNPDGHEWMRAKWSGPVRRYWKYSEKLMTKHADLMICDSVNIEKYIREEYQNYHPETCYISYGSEIAEPAAGPTEVREQAGLSENQKERAGAVKQTPAGIRCETWLREKGLASGQYYLVVGRFVPENNYETMIREFMRSHTNKAFVLITNVNDKFLAELEEKLHFRKDPRICFAGTVYDRELLSAIRQNACGYFHGHEVGGTNPSLLEALGATELNLLLDVGFNREVAEDAALYWTKQPGSLAALIDQADHMTEDDRRCLGDAAKMRIRTAYSWQKIARQYRDLFLT